MGKHEIEKQERRVLRPLEKLVPLIKADLEKMQDAQLEATARISEMLQPHRIAIGEKLLEAKPQVKHGSFIDWIRKNLPAMTTRSAQEWMRMAEAQNRTGVRFSGVQHFRRTTQPGYKTNRTGTANWRVPVQEHMNKLKVDEFTHDERDRQKEQALIVKLALEIISIGYKVLATKMHPDKGGSSEAMQRLNDARDLLKGGVVQ